MAAHHSDPFCVLSAAELCSCHTVEPRIGSVLPAKVRFHANDSSSSPSYQGEKNIPSDYRYIRGMRVHVSTMGPFAGIELIPLGVTTCTLMIDFAAQRYFMLSGFTPWL